MTGLEHAIDEARKCARLFRLGQDVEAGLAMVTLVEAAQPFVEAMPGNIQSCWADLLTSMLSDQQAQNWLSLADSLEFELVELLSASLTI